MNQQSLIQSIQLGGEVNVVTPTDSYVMAWRKSDGTYWGRRSDGVDEPIGGGSSVCEFVLIGEIDYNDLNASPLSPSLPFVFTGAKPANKYFNGSAFKTTETFISYASRNISSASGGLLAPVSSDLNIVGTEIIEPPAAGVSYNQIQDIRVFLSIAGGNLQDWTQGKMNVYAILCDFPTL